MEKEILECKLALIKMIYQFMYTTNIDGEVYFDNYCESAGESAFKVLGIKNDQIKVRELCELEEKLSRELWSINMPTKEYNGFTADDWKGILY